MEREIIRKNHELEFHPDAAKDFVYRHRNVFSKSTRRYVVKSIPPVIKEIDVAPDGKKAYWFWCFPRGEVIIYKFDRKPTKKEVMEIVKSISGKA